MRLVRLIAGIAAIAASSFALSIFIAAAPSSALQSQVPSNAASAWQTNGNVSVMAYANGVIYIGGDFTSVRPPGAAAGTGEVARGHLAAFNASTGALITSFNHSISSVKALAASPDQSTLYVGGDFTNIDGTARNRVASFATSSGALTSWNPNSNNRVSAIAASPTTVYVAGTFTSVGGRASTRIAALSASTGSALSTFTASADNLSYQIALSTDYSRLYLAGAFTNLNGDTNLWSAGVINASTGANLPFAAHSVIPPTSAACVSQGKTIKTDADGAYFGMEGTGGGCFDGTFSANSDGSLKWVSTCLGATQAVQPLNGTLYTGSHSHDCTGDQGTDPDAFAEVGWSKGLARYLLSRSTTTGKLGNWYPNTNGGTGLGPRSMATDGTQLFVGGEFTTVNGQPQQGFARFSPSTGDLAVPAQTAAPVAIARAGGKVSVFVQTPLDTDDTDLTVRLYRDNGTTPIATKQEHSLFWRQPIVGFTDDGLAVGSSHTYRVDVSETNGPNVGAKSAASNTVTVANSVPAYPTSVMSDDPSLYWRFADTHTPAIADSSDALEGGVTFGGVSLGQGGATTDSNGITTDGASGIVSSTDLLPSPTTFSVDAWFKTTSTSGGKIIGFGNDQKGYDFSGNPALSSSYDKQVYMTNDGKLIFGVYNGSFDMLSTSTAFNDGQWHQVVGTQGPTGMTLYVDGARIGHNGVTTNQSYNGYWRVGGDNLGAWPSQPTSNYFAGSIDEVSVYNHTLSLSDVVSQYSASGRTPPPSSLPTDAYGKAVVQDGASTYWRVDETSGTTAADSTGLGNTGTYSGGDTLGGPSAIGSVGTSVSFDGSTGNLASANVTSGPSVYSEELWFKTNTTNGGKLIGFGNSNNGPSSNYDRHVYMTNEGNLIFGVWNNGPDTVTTPNTYNNNQWHYMVATQGPDGMKLYVDGVLTGTNGATTSQPYQGYWRVGGDNIGGWPGQPNSSNFGGSIDEVATYEGVALTPAQIDAHYSAAGHTGPDIVPPTTAITSPADGATVNSGSVPVSATASDNVGVTAVDLQVDGTTVATDSSAPYTFTWTATDGPHSLRTVAHDAAGNTGTSDAVSVTAATPDTTDPTTAITSPADGATVYGPTTVTATASDNTGVTSVDLQVDGTTVDSDTSSPYSFTWNATAAGGHTLRTVAKDAAGNTGTSAAVNVTVVVPPDTTPPSAPGTLTGAASDATTVQLGWDAATDNVGVTGYKVVRNGTTLPGTVTGLSYTDNGLTPGATYTYTVHAVDAAGNVGPDSNPVTVTTPTTNPVLFNDSWTGANGAPWKTGWTTTAANGTVDTQGGAGRLTFTDTAGANARAQLTGVSPNADTELLTSFQWSANTPTAFLNVWLRGSGGWQGAYRPVNGYGIQLQSNSASVVVQKNVSSTTTTLATVASGQAVSTAKQWLRLRVVGSTIEFKVWTDGAAEPATWKSVVTDSSVTAPGQLFVSLNRGSTNTGVKAVTLDDLQLFQG